LESEIETLATFVASRLAGKIKLPLPLSTSFVRWCDGQLEDVHVPNQLVHKPAKFVQTPGLNAFVETECHTQFVQTVKSKPFVNAHPPPNQLVHKPAQIVQAEKSKLFVNAHPLPNQFVQAEKSKPFVNAHPPPNQFVRTGCSQ
jgi:hypothetical protein